jgi:hypothetical protein
MDEFEWDGTHLDDTNLFKWLKEQDIKFGSLNTFCNCVAYSSNKGCCSLVVDDEKVRLGDKLYVEDNTVKIERGDTEPFICPVHKEEHKGTGPYLCMHTGQLE